MLVRVVSLPQGPILKVITTKAEGGPTHVNPAAADSIAGTRVYDPNEPRNKCVGLHPEIAGGG